MGWYSVFLVLGGGKIKKGNLIRNITIKVYSLDQCGFCNHSIAGNLSLAVGISNACFFGNKGLQQRCFSVNFAKFLTTFFYRTPLGDCFWKRFSVLTHILKGLVTFSNMTDVFF